VRRHVAPPVCTKPLFALRRADHQQAAALSGMAQSVGYFIAGVRPLVFGAIYDTAQRWRGPAALLLAPVLVQIAPGYLSGWAKIVHVKLPRAC
jgi:MFS transporter, CP family, cyanate transporter